MIDTEVLELIGGSSRDRLAESYRRMVSAGASRRDIHRVMTDQLTSSLAHARINGEALAIRQLTELGIPVAPGYGRVADTTENFKRAAVQAAAERERLGAAVDTILADGLTDAAEMRVGRLALAESIEAARGRTAELMTGTEEIEGWTRQLDSDPCELCTWWARDARIWPASHTMPTHKGCACAQRWTRAASASVRIVSREGQIDSARRAEAGTLDERRTMGEGTWSRRSTRGRPKR